MVSGRIGTSGVEALEAPNLDNLWLGLLEVYAETALRAPDAALNGAPGVLALEQAYTTVSSPNRLWSTAKWDLYVVFV